VGDDLLIEGRNMHAEAPAQPGEDVRPSRQPVWQAVYRGLLTAIHHSADAPLGIDSVQAAILPAGVLRTHLVFSFQALEMPIDIIRWSNRCSHELILLLFKKSTTRTQRIFIEQLRGLGVLHDEFFINRSENIKNSVSSVCSVVIFLQ